MAHVSFKFKIQFRVKSTLKRMHMPKKLFVINKQKLNIEFSKIIIAISMLICSIVGSYAASPIEITLNSINYRLNESNKTATVIGLNDNVSDVDISAAINYNNESYNVTEILQEAFAYNDNIVSVRIPDTVVEIGYSTFRSCKKLSNVILGKSIKTIGNSSFAFCHSLKEVILPDSVEAIGFMAFSDCRDLETINIPICLKNIYQAAFDDCDKLKNIHINDIASYCSVNISDYADLFFINSILYSQGELISELIIPDGVERISARIFSGCGSIESLTLPKTLKFINYSAFSDCPILKEVNIYSDAEIGSGVFHNCAQLSTINIYSVIPPTLGANVFNESYPEYMTLHVPKGYKEYYSSTSGWKDFGTIIDDLPNEAGIENVSIDNNQPIDIYSLDGVRVFSGISNYELESGIYIIRQGMKCKKIIIK